MIVLSYTGGADFSRYRLVWFYVWNLGCVLRKEKVVTCTQLAYENE